MTTAHRATFKPAIGGEDQGGNRLMVPSRQYSSKDLPGHTHLKLRKAYQGSKDDLKTMDYRSKLVESEYKAKIDKMKADNRGAPLDERDIRRLWSDLSYHEGYRQ